jgi:3-hydroxyacyl-CoA dehydrogenase/enoyl-CoA hydratase/3-hydroxybutyryl-CoA epimerase
MGAGIAQLLAFNGIPVVLKDINEQIAAAGRAKVAALTADAAKKGVLSRDEAEAVVDRVTASSDWAALTQADLVIEAVVEREDIKRDVFRQLAERLSPTAVFASNTSALSVSRLAEGISNPGRVAGLHFFNPVHKMHLVEVIRGHTTNDETIATLTELVRRLGKVPIVVADRPGFLVNRILFPYLDEAVRLVMEGIPGSIVDREAVRFGMPMGPLELLDQVGIDVAADVAKTLGTLRSEVGPTPERLASMAREGSTGLKSGRGFYVYKQGKKGEPSHWAMPETKWPRLQSNADASGLTDLQRRLIYPMINEAAKCLDGVVNEPWAVDLGMVLGTGFAPFRGGPLHVADAIGMSSLVIGLRELSHRSGSRFTPAALLEKMDREESCFFPTETGRTLIGAAVG